MCTNFSVEGRNKYLLDRPVRSFQFDRSIELAGGGGVVKRLTYTVYDKDDDQNVKTCGPLCFLKAARPKTSARLWNWTAVDFTYSCRGVGDEQVLRRRSGLGQLQVTAPGELLGRVT